VYDFLLVRNSNLDLPRIVRDTATYWLKIVNFAYPLSFSTLIWDDPLRMFGKALWFLKLDSSRQRMVKMW